MGNLVLERGPGRTYPPTFAVTKQEPRGATARRRSDGPEAWPDREVIGNGPERVWPGERSRGASAGPETFAFRSSAIGWLLFAALPRRMWPANREPRCDQRLLLRPLPWQSTSSRVAGLQDVRVTG